ncbi:MAG: DUF3037 domain-containing protein [Streptosporangiaceae bacterium]
MSYERHGFEYAVLRVVPRVDRGEMINAGVLLYCRPLRFLAARVALDAQRVLALDPAADLGGIERALTAVVQICDQPPGAGPAALQDIGRRFRWLTAPRSTVVQPGPVHTGLTADPDAEADRLLAALVLLPPAAPARTAHDLRDWGRPREA